MPADSIFCDGFDHYSTTELDLKWSALAGYNSSNNTVDQTGGRNGKGCLSTHQAYLIKNVTRTKYFLVSFAFKMVNNNGPFLNINDTVGSGAQLIGLRWTSGNQISVYSPASGSTLGTSSSTFVLGNWYYIEFKIEIDSLTSAGWCKLQVNSNVEIDLASQSTYWGTSTQADQVFLGSISGAINSFDCKIDDVIIQTGIGSTFFGDVVVEALYPAGNGAHTDFTAVGSSNRYNCVNNHPPDGDTTYIGSVTTSDRNTFTMSATIDAIVSVKAVQTCIMARKSGVGTRTIAPSFRQSGTDHDGTAVALGSSYAMTQEVFLTNPATGNPWTAAEITALEFGIEVAT